MLPPFDSQGSSGRLTFTTKASLQAAVQAYNANPTAAIATNGPIAEWDVSAITDMSWLFYNLKNFNADISNWDTSSVTTMQRLFYVRSFPRALPRICSRALPCTLRASPSPAASRLPGHTFPPQHMPSLRLGRAQTPCPTPTSCSSVARGRAPRPSPTARAGVRGPARRAEP